MKQLQYKDALKLANMIYRSIDIDSDNGKLYIVGSIRREEPDIKDIDILIYTKEFNPNLLRTLDLHKMKWKVKSVGERRLSAIVEGVNCDIFYACCDELPYALLHHTGSASYNIRLRRLANLMGLKLNQYGLFYLNSNRKIFQKFTTESQILRFLGSSKIDPRERY